MYIFLWKRHYNYSSFFSGTFFFQGLYFFSGVIFFWCLDLFFSFLALNPLEPIIFEHWLPNLKNPKLAAQHQQFWKNIDSKQKKLYFWGPSNLRKHSFKNYSSGKKGTIFLGGHPNLRKHSFKNASKIIVPEKKELYLFLGGHPNLRKHSFKNYSSKTNETCKSAAQRL